MAWGGVNALVVSAVAALALRVVHAHPLCYLDDTSPALDATATYCPNDETDGFCCTAEVEDGLQTTLDASGATGGCADLYKEVNLLWFLKKKFYRFEHDRRKRDVAAGNQTLKL